MNKSGGARIKGLFKERYITPYGYVRICTPDERRIFEHRYEMEKFIGRKLKKQEVVHHINENKLDNKIENLKLFKNHAHHMRECCGIKCTRRWDKIEVPKIKYNRWNKRPIGKCMLKGCERISRHGSLCHPCYISYRKWKTGLIKNHFSESALTV